MQITESALPEGKGDTGRIKSVKGVEYTFKEGN